MKTILSTAVLAAMASNAMEVQLLTVEPGHFHAALVQKVNNPLLRPECWVYGEEGEDLQRHLALINEFNSRTKDPTHWQVKRLTEWKNVSPTALGNDVKMLVVLAGRNDRKADNYLTALENGLNVLSDKPLVINEEGFAKLEKAVQVARAKGLFFADIMTERKEITTILQKELSKKAALYGEQLKGTVEEPGVEKVSVHHFYKLVNGKALQRPGWYYDVTKQGEGIMDVTTHLVDLVQWELFGEDKPLKKSDVQILRSSAWNTPISAQEYLASTGLKQWPDFLKGAVDANNVLQCAANGEMIYTLKGVNAKVTVEWKFKAPVGGGDTHYSVMRGSKADVIIRQNKDTGFKPWLYVRVKGDKAGSVKAFEQALAELNAKWPGLKSEETADGWRIVVPNEYEVGHEAHFGQVMGEFLSWMQAGKEPSDYLDNMLVKYYTMIQARKQIKK